MSADRGSAEPPNLVLVDTSVWVRFFRVADSPEAQTLDALLAAGPVATCPPIRAEVVSGAKNRREFDRLSDLFDALVNLEPPVEIWRKIEGHRFELAKRGYQASLIDLMIALTAYAHDVVLWSVDDDFTRIASIIPLTRFHHQKI